ncbi:uncharacterized protein IL334_001028 [Kwoniella shivajii]|uniref:Amidase domain-containing protein n=1 Tax=Kwoniella shivajii TaxID=564305 RepID=A0ABZ1CSE3_9TREE|nr:hypothetical protein IL334_001028 [Kwoniella shivajii]
MHNGKFQMDAHLKARDTLHAALNKLEYLGVKVRFDTDILNSPFLSQVKRIIGFEFNDKYSTHGLPPNQCCQERLVDSLRSSPRYCPEHELMVSATKRLSDDKGLGYIFDNNPDIDAIAKDLSLCTVCPVYGLAQVVILLNQSMVSAIKGIVPMGYCDNGLPFGLMFITRKWEENKLISLMAAYEKVMPKRKSPQPFVDKHAA